MKPDQNFISRFRAARTAVFALSLSIVAVFTVVSLAAVALDKGDVVSNVKIKDSRDKDAEIPDLGSKVMAVFYTDPDVKNQNEPFRELLKQANLDRTKFRGLGVVNMKDTWLANSIIRSVVRGKEKKFDSLILTDPAHILKNAWNLGDCNGKDVVIILGRDRKVRYFKAGQMSDAEMKAGLELVRSLIAE